jgi:hypothetical protein
MTITMATRDEDEAALDAANQRALEAARRHRIQKALDDALAATFPASDPVAIVTSQDEEAWHEPEPPRPKS